MLLWHCNSANNNTTKYLNTDTTKAHYVGMETCRKCHEPIYQTYIKTGMGQSWGYATKTKSAADFSPAHALVYDSFKNFYYKPYWDGDSLAIMEYRLQGKDTVHKHIEKISYIVGSGQHTNSHIINTNGYLHQAPITYYTQKKMWDLAPGFEHGSNTRFDRKIELECISCHNGYPVFEPQSFNKYSQIKTGIDCERCHGPGSLHAEQNLAGKFYDTSKGPDYRIVNPKKLTTEAQNSLCQRCHLQGVAVLNDTKSFFDFLPSQDLKNTQHVFLPNIGGSKNGMIMASHVERLKMSACYTVSNAMSCITCHNPHISVKETPVLQYNSACLQCHTQNNSCSQPMVQRVSNNNNCSACHMHKNSSIDIPHVAVTDHFIRKNTSVKNDKEIATFLGMTCYNDDNTNAQTRARAFLEFYERYQPSQQLLDSAAMLLHSVSEKNTVQYDWIRYYFLKKEYKKIIELSNSLKPNTIQDAWTLYRIGESYQKNGQSKEAIPYYQQAVHIKKYGLDFQYKYATALLDTKNIAEAKQVLLFILSENPNHAEANSGLAYVYMQENNLPLAKQYIQKSLELNPDNIQAILNAAILHYQLHNKAVSKILLQHALQLDPANIRVQQMLEELK